MATTAGVINATDIGIYVGATKIANITSGSLSLTHGTREITTNDSAGWEGTAPGKRGWEISGDSLFTFDAAFTFDDLFAIFIARTLVTLKQSTENAGDKKYTGTAYLTALSCTGSTEDNETYSYTFKGSGSLVEATI
jgi:TP901-1 family phage major tail protein